MVEWHVITNGSPPPTFALSLANPTTTNTIAFVAESDGKTYGNSCAGSTICGKPLLAIDSTNLTLTVSFTAPVTNIARPEIVIPVNGVDGQFGPLASGAWVFHILGRSYPFDVTEAPLSLSIERLANSLAFQLSWPVSGDPFALEFSDILPAQNWQAVTNPPTASNNLNTIQIQGADIARIFRLRQISF
jgi:hypothetical protein